MSPLRPRVLICEDSRTYATALARMVEHGHQLEVVGISRTAEAAIGSLAQLRPDVVTMDIELPGMSGLEAVERIMNAHPVPILVISSQVRNGSTHAHAALAAGALDAVSKQELDLLDPDGVAAGAFRRRLALLSGVRVIHHPRAGLERRASAPRRASRQARAIGICASAGGPKALATILASLPATFPIPILVVQHMTTGFVEGLVRWLDSTVSLPVRLATDGANPERGVWLAPGDAHLLLTPAGLLTLDTQTPGAPHRPSADLLLQSMAATVGKDAVAVVLTGMGKDGADGAESVRDAGGIAIAQDEETSAIYGMPRAAFERGVDFVLPLTQIGPELSSLTPAGKGR